uniref:Putative reverse transcriptase-rnase h-integrase n=1 Tax=Moniliophthora roreri TaxID=221103 RepID=A0A0W0FN80_MONRR
MSVKQAGMGVDLITGLPESQGYDAIIIYVNLYSKQVHVLPTVTTLNAKGVADIHYREIFRLHGIPYKFVSDRGPQFAAQVTQALHKHLGIQAGLTTAYHPSANGQTEQANQEIEQFLRLFVSKRQDDWVDWLPTAEFILNS